MKVSSYICKTRKVLNNVNAEVIHKFGNNLFMNQYLLCEFSFAELIGKRQIPLGHILKLINGLCNKSNDINIMYKQQKTTYTGSGMKSD